MKIAPCLVVLAALNGAWVAAAADVYQWSVRKSEYRPANICKVVTSKSAYKAELTRLRIAPGTDPIFPYVDWAKGQKALIFAAVTDGKTEYRFTQAAANVFSFAVAGSSGFPVSEVIVVHLPRNYPIENGCSCQTESPQQYARIGGGRLASVSSALDADELAEPLTQGQLTVTGGPLAFHNQTVKTTSAPQTITVTNKGPSAITMGAITLNNRTGFAISANTCPSAGHTLAANASGSITVTFTPPTAGPKRGTLIVDGSEPGRPILVGLTGTGTAN